MFEKKVYRPESLLSYISNKPKNIRFRFALIQRIIGFNSIGNFKISYITFMLISNQQQSKNKYSNLFQYLNVISVWRL